MLEVLIHNKVVTPSSPDAWSQADVDAAAAHFEECDILTPYAAMCQTLGCRYADFLRPLREAAERESAKYGRQVPADDQYYIMHRVPPRGGDDGHPAIIKDPQAGTTGSSRFFGLGRWTCNGLGRTAWPSCSDSGRWSSSRRTGS